MAQAAFDLEELKRRMEGALTSLRSEFAGLRTGRASSQLLDPIMVEAYGTSTPLTQVAGVTAPEARMLTVQVWDKVNVGAVDKAIRAAGLGLNPVMDGTTLRVPIPALNEERRAELAKLAGRYAEAARVAVRNVRRDGMEIIKKQEKDGMIGQDQHKKLSEQIQQATDQCIRRIDETVRAKEEEIMQV
jgi:ribosome recycling factor